MGSPHPAPADSGFATLPGALFPDTGPASAEHSRFVRRIRRRYAAELSMLSAGLPARDTIDALIAAFMRAGRPLASAMRVTRQLVLERLAVLDVEQGASMADITCVMTELAEVTLDRALAQACAASASTSGSWAWASSGRAS